MINETLLHVAGTTDAEVAILVRTIRDLRDAGTGEAFADREWWARAEVGLVAALRASQAKTIHGARLKIEFGLWAADRGGSTDGSPIAAIADGYRALSAMVPPPQLKECKPNHRGTAQTIGDRDMIAACQETDGRMAALAEIVANVTDALAEPVGERTGLVLAETLQAVRLEMARTKANTLTASRLRLHQCRRAFQKEADANAALAPVADVLETLDDHLSTAVRPREVPGQWNERILARIATGLGFVQETLRALEGLQRSLPIMRALTIAVIDTQRLVKEAQRSMVEARAAMDDGVSQIADLAAALDAVRRAANALSDEPTPLYGHVAKLEEEIAGRLRRAHATNEADAAIREKALLMFIANPPESDDEDEHGGGIDDRSQGSWADVSSSADRDAMLRRQGDAHTIGDEL